MFCGHQHATRTAERTVRPVRPVQPAGHTTVPPVDPSTRVTDRDRQATIDQLRLNTGVGRLDIDEFAARTERALQAQTAGDLAEITADLPFMESPADRERRARATRAELLRPYLSVMALLVGIWLLTSIGEVLNGEWPLFWPIFPMLGWGIPLAIELRNQDQRSTTAA